MTATAKAGLAMLKSLPWRAVHTVKFGVNGPQSLQPQKSVRKRADILLVERGFFSSRARAQAAIAAGLVSVGGAALNKASQEVADNASIEAQAPHPWVSRGGVKLAAALDAFTLDPS